VRGQVADELLLGHDAPVLGQLRDGAPKPDRRVTPKAPLCAVRRIDESGRSRTPPATTYSVFTAWKVNSQKFGTDLGRRKNDV